MTDVGGPGFNGPYISNAINSKRVHCKCLLQRERSIDGPGWTTASAIVSSETFRNQAPSKLPPNCFQSILSGTQVESKPIDGTKFFAVLGTATINDPRDHLHDLHEGLLDEIQKLGMLMWKIHRSCPQRQHHPPWLPRGGENPLRRGSLGMAGSGFKHL